MTASTSNSRHLLFRLGESTHLPDALLGVLRDEVVLAGWLRASGLLHDVRLRSLGGGAQGATRTVSGPVHVLMLDGSIGLAHGDVTCGLRALLARETETGLETVAGEILEARVGALEVLVTALDDLTATRQVTASGVWITDATAGKAPPAPVHVPAPVHATPVAPAPPEPEVAKPAPPSPPKPSPTFSTPAAMPPRPVKPVIEVEEQVYPDAGDVVEHFAFGRCEVVKSDGDRLHLRLGKDGRVKEIALEMLKVTPLDPVEGQSGRHFKLDRKL
jgi:predicted DNA-binding protein with PD1-like motif